MKIWVDADACPLVIKEILYRAAARVQVELVLVANKLLKVPVSPYIRSLRVEHGFDAADRYIAESVTAGDLVVTADVPLAAQVVERGGLALNPRGELYTADNVREHLSRRDMMDELRGLGVIGGGPAPFSDTDKRAFANKLDAVLTKALREQGYQ
jgi:uncharacterized protein YaiI (UPF0178 family)